MGSEGVGRQSHMCGHILSFGHDTERSKEVQKTEHEHSVLCLARMVVSCGCGGLKPDESVSCLALQLQGSATSSVVVHVVNFPMRGGDDDLAMNKV